MRLFELILCISVLLAMIDIYLLRSVKMRRQISIVLFMLCFLSLAGQLLIEDYRWQMILAYIATALIIKKLAGCIMERADTVSGVRKRGAIIPIILLSLSFALSALLPVFTLPRPEGPFKVGTQTFYMKDENRDETLTYDPGDKREIMVQVWYPAQASDKPTQMLYPEDKVQFRSLIQTFSESMKIPGFFLDYFRYIRTNSYADANLYKAAKPYPLIILNHGMGTTRLIHASQAEQLASNGYIVAAIDHTYSTSGTAFPDGTVTEFKTSVGIDNMAAVSQEVGRIWAEDVIFVIDQFERMNEGSLESVFKGAIDLDKIGVMGHSFGGSTSYSALCMDNRIKAAINMDGSFFTLDGTTKTDKPFLFITDDAYEERIKFITKGNPSDEELKEEGLTREEYEKLIPMYKDEQSILENSLNKEILIIPGMGHFNVTDLQLYSKLIKYTGMTGSIDGVECARLVNRYVLGFFDEHLRGLVE